MSIKAGKVGCTLEETIIFVEKSLGLMVGKEKIMSLRSNGSAWFYTLPPKKDLLVKIEGGRKHITIYPELDNHWNNQGDTTKLFELESRLTESVGFSVERKFAA